MTMVAEDLAQLQEAYSQIQVLPGMSAWEYLELVRERYPDLYRRLNPARVPPEHVARLKLIADMRGEGMNLRTIKRVIDGVPSAEGMLGFGQALLGAFSTEEPEVTTGDDAGTTRSQWQCCP